MTATPASVAADLRRLADMVEGSPDVFEMFRYAFYGINVFPDGKDKMAAFVRAGLKHGAKVDKKFNDTWFSAVVTFDSVSVEGNAHREEVCERVVVGTETVTKTVKDPEALAAVPEIEVSEEVETVEWRCGPLLAGVPETR